MAKKVTSPPLSLKARAARVNLIGMDIDGVLTGGEVIVLHSGEEVKLWNAKDRLGLALMRDAGVPLKIVWITGRQSETVTRAAHDLGVHHVVQKCANKKAAMIDILEKEKMTLAETAFIGDDLIDLPLLTCVGFAACPKNAVPDVLSRVHYVSPQDGGRGAVRDVCEFILKAQNRWATLINPFLS